MKTSPLLVSLPLLASALMSGCANQATPSAGAASAPATPPAAPAALCDAAPAQSAVGQTATASVMESARVRSGAQMARVLRPGQIITKEFNAQRLNLEVDANGRILAVRCG